MSTSTYNFVVHPQRYKVLFEVMLKNSGASVFMSCGFFY